MAKRLSDDEIKLALVEIQHRLQRPMSANDFGAELVSSFPDRAEDPSFFYNAAKRADELYRLGIFVVAPKKARDSRNKLVLQYGLPQYVQGGLSFTQKQTRLMAERIEMLSAMLATSTLLQLQSHIKGLKLTIDEKSVTADMLKIEFEMLKKGNIDTIVRLCSTYFSTIGSVAEAAITEEQLEKANDDHVAAPDHS